MKLTKTDVEVLIEFGYQESDMRQIGEAMTRTVYTLYKNGKEKRISRLEARELLGDKEYLSGISRSAFHLSSMRNVSDEESIYFDSSRLFE